MLFSIVAVFSFQECYVFDLSMLILLERSELLSQQGVLIHPLSKQHCTLAAQPRIVGFHKERANRICIVALL